MKVRGYLRASRTTASSTHLGGSQRPPGHSGQKKILPLLRIEIGHLVVQSAAQPLWWLLYSGYHLRYVTAWKEKSLNYVTGPWIRHVRKHRQHTRFESRMCNRQQRMTDKENRMQRRISGRRSDDMTWVGKNYSRKSFMSRCLHQIL